MLIHKDSHVDHFPADIIKMLAYKFSGKKGFFIETFELAEVYGTYPCHLHGPATGTPPVADDEAEWRDRDGREFKHRMCDRKAVQTRMITVIAGPHDGHDCVMFTAYAGPQSPKMVGDPTLENSEEAEAIEFWKTHALSQ